MTYINDHSRLAHHLRNETVPTVRRFKGSKEARLAYLSEEVGKVMQSCITGGYINPDIQKDGDGRAAKGLFNVLRHFVLKCLIYPDAGSCFIDPNDLSATWMAELEDKWLSEPQAA